MSFFNKIAKKYEAHCFLQQEVSSRLIDRLNFIKLSPSNILDIGTGTGSNILELSKIYPKANIFGLDSSIDMLKENNNNLLVCSDMENLCFKPNCFDLIVSNLSLHWCKDLTSTLEKFKNILKDNAPILFTLFGPDTIREYLEYTKNQNAYFFDMHDIGDLLLSLNWKNPVIDKENITVNYDDVSTLTQDLLNTGLLEFTGNSDKKFKYPGFTITFPLTYEISYILAWNNNPKKIQTNISTKDC